MDGETVGRWILEVGHRLFEEGSLPGLPSWEQEESPELRVSLTAWWGDEVSETSRCRQGGGTAGGGGPHVFGAGREGLQAVKG